MLRLANFLLLATLLFAGLACEADPNSVASEGRYSPDSLYARMGDGRVLRSLVDRYFELAVNDRTLNFTRTGTPYAWEPNPGNIATLKDQYFNYLSSATGGPAHYSGPAISAVHEYLDITPQQFARSLDLFQEAAQSAGVRPKEQQELITILTNQMLDVLGKNAVPTTQPTRH